MDVIKVEPGYDPLELKDEVILGQEGKPLSEEDHFFGVNVKEIKVEPYNESYDDASDVTCRENESSGTFYVVKCEVEEEFWNEDAVKEEVMPGMTVENGDLTEKSLELYCHGDGKSHRSDTFKMSIDFCSRAQHAQMVVNQQLTDSCGSSDKISDQKFEFCDNGNPVAQDLKQGSDTDLGVKYFKCKLCGEDFRYQYRLREHALTHTGEKNYKCNICDKSFAQIDYLRKHTLRHTGKKSFKCDVCDRRFEHRSHLRGHELTHKRKKPFKCDICGVHVARLRYLRVHRAKHTQNRNFKCNLCGETFALLQNLQVHSFTHTGKKQYRCNICGKNFAQLFQLRTHVSMHIN